MEDALPLYNSVNAPLELCEQVRERFLAFLNGFVISEPADGEPSASGTLSQGSGARGRAGAGAGVAGRAAGHPPRPGQPAGCWGRALGPPRAPPVQPACARLRQAAAPPSPSASTWSSWPP